MIANIAVHHRQRHWARAQYRSRAMHPGGLERSPNETPPRALSIVVATTHHVAIVVCRPRSAHHSEPVPSCQRQVAARAGAPPAPAGIPVGPCLVPGRSGSHVASWSFRPPSHMSPVRSVLPLLACLGHRLPCACLLPSCPPEHCFPFPPPACASFPKRNEALFSSRKPWNPKCKARAIPSPLAVGIGTKTPPPAHAELRCPTHSKPTTSQLPLPGQVRVIFGQA
jgi:hypothetical protein